MDCCVFRVQHGCGGLTMRYILAVALLLAASAAKADTLFTLTGSQGTASFTIGANELPDSSYYDALQYDVPIDINGVTAPGIVYMYGMFHDPASISFAGATWVWLGIPFNEPYTAPTFNLGTFPSLTWCGGMEMASCHGVTGLDQGHPTLTVTDPLPVDTVEPGTAGFLLLGLLGLHL